MNLSEEEVYLLAAFMAEVDELAKRRARNSGGLVGRESIREIMTVLLGDQSLPDGYVDIVIEALVEKRDYEAVNGSTDVLRYKGE